MNLADCGDGVWVGNYFACDAGGFDLTLHAWRPENLADGRICRCCREVATGVAVHHLVLTYREGESLARIPVPIDGIAAHARRPGRLLAHCAGGSVRGPTLAVMAKVARGVAFGRAVEDVMRAASSYDENVFGNAGLVSIFRFGAAQPRPMPPAQMTQPCVPSRSVTLANPAQS
jgi:hypothetical protein